MTFGYALILMAALFAVVSFAAAWRWLKGGAGAERVFRAAYGAMTAALVLALVLLIRAILGHDFRYDYVIGYSSRDLPPLYLWSALWGGQEGTYLLWAVLAAALGYFLFRRDAWQRAAVMTGYVPTIAILIAFMLNENGNPFRLAPVVPPDGRGLNPLLQDPWMAYHPPVVFLGYAAMSIPGVLAWVAAFRRDDKGWLADGLRFSLFGFITLGIGIILGGVWAYKVLGWGGFWGWDPVENASLVPWIVGTALLHGLLVQQSTGALRRTNLILAMACYFLVMYSTFLTRSGVLADFSVHSFPKGTIYGWIVGALVAVALVSVVAQFRWRAPAGPGIQTAVAWPFVLSATIVLFSISAFLVLVGTSLPLISSIAGKPATVTAPFYNSVNLPVYVLLLAVLGIGPFLTWAALPARLWARRVIPSVAVAVLGTALAVVLGGRGFGALLLFFMALLALTSNILRFVEVSRRRFLLTGAAVAHAGFALMFLGIVAGESWDRQQTFELVRGKPVQAFGRTLTFTGQIPGSAPKDRWAVQVVSPKGGSRTEELVFYQMENGQIFKKPAIQRGLGGDFYLAPNSLEVPRPTGHGGGLELTKNDPVEFGGATLTFLRFEMGGHGDSGGGMGGMGGAADEGGMTVNAIVRVASAGKEDNVVLPLRMTDSGMKGTPVAVEALGGRTLTLSGMSVEQGLIRLEAEGGAGSGSAADELAGAILTIEASTKPMIWLLWVGTAFLALGCVIAFVRRVSDRRVAVPARADQVVRGAARG